MAKLIWGIDPLAVSRLGRTGGCQFGRVPAGTHGEKTAVHEKGAGAHRHSGAQDPPRAGGAGAIDGR